MILVVSIHIGTIFKVMTMSLFYQTHFLTKGIYTFPLENSKLGQLFGIEFMHFGPKHGIYSSQCITISLFYQKLLLDVNACPISSLYGLKKWDVKV